MSSSPVNLRSAWVSRAMLPIGRLSAGALVLGTVLAEAPEPGSRRLALWVTLVVTTVLLLVALSARVHDRRLMGGLLVASGLGGALLNLLQPSGPGFLASYVAMAGIGLALRPRAAAAAGAPVLIAAVVVQGLISSQPVSAVLNFSLGALFLLITSAFAAVSRDAQSRAEALAAEEQALVAARAQSAVLAERARLARELHDILAHTLSGLTLQLSGATLLAEQTGADPRLTAQLSAAHRLAKDGTANAKRAVSALRGDALPGPDALPGLVEETRRATGLPITLSVSGSPRRLAPEAGLAIYRTVQEALTNTARYAGPGASVAVELAYGPEDVRLTVTDTGGRQPEPAVAGAGGGLGLAGLGERAALHGGHLEHGPTAQGWRVALTLPAEVTA